MHPEPVEGCILFDQRMLDSTWDTCSNSTIARPGTASGHFRATGISDGPPWIYPPSRIQCTAFDLANRSPCSLRTSALKWSQGSSRRVSSA